jgi:hypothetical protein
MLGDDGGSFSGLERLGEKSILRFIRLGCCYTLLHPGTHFDNVSLERTSLCADYFLSHLYAAADNRLQEHQAAVHARLSSS